MLPPSFAWKLVLAISLGAVIFASARARPPRRRTGGAELRLLVSGALLLYAIGVIASLSHHGVLAAILYSAGISMSALSAWLSRGTDSDEPPPDHPADEHPPPAPERAPLFDWTAFERQFRAYDRGRRARDRTPVA